jgi:hypothetical protein
MHTGAPAECRDNHADPEPPPPPPLPPCPRSWWQRAEAGGGCHELHAGAGCQLAGSEPADDGPYIG